MKIAVTGGTGFVGRNLVNRLLRDNHQITVLTNRQSGKDLFNGEVRFVKGSVHNSDEMIPALDGCEVVYHLVGLIAETRTKTFDKTVAQGSNNVLMACNLAGVKKIIYLSALGVTADAQTKYFRTKYEAEQAVMRSDLEWTIFRSSIIYGKGDGFLTMMSKIIRLSPTMPVFGSGTYKLQPVFIGDLVEVLTGALRVEAASKQIIDVAGPEQLEYVRILGHIKKAIGKKRMNLYIPMAVIRPVAALLEFFLKPAPLTRDQLVMLEQGSVGDISKMKELFQIEPIDFENGLKSVTGDSTND